jgi:hypothetical protein
MIAGETLVTKRIAKTRKKIRKFGKRSLISQCHQTTSLDLICAVSFVPYGLAWHFLIQGSTFFLHTVPTNRLGRLFPIVGV